jgi:uncharacterized membrane protein YfcA
MSDPVWTYTFLCVSAFLAGVMNSVAGGGTLLTFPALLTALRPLFGDAAAAVANATSTVALLPGSFAGAAGYRTELAASRRFVLRMLAPSLLGGLLGAWLLSQDKEAFAKLVPWLILTAAVLFLLQQPIARWMRTHRPDHEPGPLGQAALLAAQFLIAVYGGYFGAGIGILMLTALGFMGVGDMHRMNAVKTFLAATINASSLVVFIPSGLVYWPLAGVLAGAAIVGGYAGARVARRLPAAVVRWVVIVIGFGLAAYYFARR